MGIFEKKKAVPDPEVGTVPNSVGARGEYDIDEHILSPAEVADRFGTVVDWANVGGSQGLTSQQVAELQSKNGPNRLTPPKKTPEIIKFLLQFTNPLMALLLVAGALTFMAYGLQSPRDKNNAILAAALIIVVTLTCILSYWQERSASNVMASLKKMMPNNCTVIRDGHEQKVEALALVPGDLVRLYMGDRVPADIRIIETFDLKVDCSSLTGESDVVPASVDRKHDIPAEARNVVFMSSLAMNGEGRGLVIRTGDGTMIGKIASLATDTSTHRSTLQVEVHRLVCFIGILAFTIAIILFVVGLGRKMDPLGAFVNGFILVVVANVPEGLPATVTSLLSLTALRLRDRNVLIKRTDIIENLGAATIIASDKTGTLTQNKMSVENLYCNLELHKGSTFQPPPAGPRPSLDRASVLARQSLARRSKLGRPSQLGRTSRPVTTNLGRSSSLARVSRDPVTHMSVGRSARPKGDGSFEFHKDTPLVPSKRLEPTVEESAHTFTVQAFNDLTAVSWDRSSALTQLLTIACVCNKAKFTVAEEMATPEGKPAHTAINVPMSQSNQEDNRKVLGDATDIGLLRYVDRLTPSSFARMAYKQVFDIPFNSVNKWSLAVTICPGDNAHQIVMMKGAPEIILSKCTHHLHNRQEKQIDEVFWAFMNAAYERCGFMGERVIGLAYKKIPACSVESFHEEGLGLLDFRASMNAAYERCGCTGERVIGFAYKKIPARSVESFYEEGQGPPTEGLAFMGLVSLVDPPRNGVLQAVNKCRTAGIRVAMVTGDHPLTAEAIARKVGIVTLMTSREVAAEAGVAESEIEISDERVGAVVVTGGQMRNIKTEDEWDDILTKHEIVFARTSPQQKLQIVENLQRLGEIVAVTGDGVNDSPALKRAQIGVAMGQGGSDVARDAADIVLMDDEFPSIVNAIEEGRVIYDNLKKTIAYTLGHAMPEVFPLFLNLVLNFPLGLGGLLMLSIDLITEQGPAISLAYEPAEANVMERPPRDLSKDRLVDGPLLRYAYLIYGVITSAICMIAFFTIFWWYGVPLSLVYNMGVTYWSWSAPDLAVDGCRTIDGQQVCNILTAGQQVEIYFAAQAAWYITLVCSQFWHIWLCKTRSESVFVHGIFRNMVTVYGVFVSCTVMIIIVYVHVLQGFFTTAFLPGIGWVPMIGTLLWLLPYTEYTKMQTRKNPDGWWTRHMAW